MKRWSVLLAAVVVHLCLGGIYAWSAFVPALRQSFGYSAAQTQLVFGSTLAIMCLAALVTGPLQDRYGPKWLTLASGGFTAAAYLCAGYFGDRFIPLWLSIACLGSAGIAFGYLPVLSTTVQWFPDRRGMAAGIVVAGYGSAAMILSAAVRYLLVRGWEVLDIFRILGGIYGILIIIASRFVVLPVAPGGAGIGNFRLGNYLGDRRLWALALGLFAATYPGLSIIGDLKPIGLWFNLSDAATSAAIATLALGNGAGRIAWGFLYDRLGGRRTIVLCMVMIAASVIFLAMGSFSATIFLAGAFFFGFCYGGSLAIFPARTAEIFGPALLGSLYPVVLATHGMAGIAGAPIAGWMADKSGGHYPGFALALAVTILGLVVYLRLTRNPQHS